MKSPGTNAAYGTNSRKNLKEKTGNNVMEDLKRLIDAALISLLPLTVLSCVMGILSDSLTILTVSIDSGLSLIVNFFAFYSIRLVLKQNIFMFPYGAGKLENFSSFLYGTLMIPTSMFILYFAISRFMTPPKTINFGMTQLASIPQFLRSLVLFVWTVRLLKNKATESPILDSYYINFKVTLLSDLSIIVAFAAAFVLNHLNYHKVAYAIDPVFSCLIGVYMLYNGIQLLSHNFKSLINLPLPESDQFKIMKVLTEQFDSYENIGNIYTSRSGKTRFIEIELYLKKQTSFSDITHLRELLTQSLKMHFHDVRFILIPLEYQDSEQ
jgi:cation diffusion facilitator family transporter